MQVPYHAPTACGVATSTVLYSQSRTTNPWYDYSGTYTSTGSSKSDYVQYGYRGMGLIGAYGQRRKRKDSFLISIIYVPYLVNSAIIQNYWHNPSEAWDEGLSPRNA